MVRSSYKNKQSKQRRNQTIKIRGGAMGGVRYKCPYCDSTFSHTPGVYRHCHDLHPGRTAPTSQTIHAVPINIAVAARSDRQLDMDDAIGQRMLASAAAAARPSGAAAAARPSGAAAAARPSGAAAAAHPFGAAAAARPSGAAAAARPSAAATLAAAAATSASVAAASAEYDGLGEPPTEAFMDLAITFSIMIDPVVASDGFTYERSGIEQWFASGKRTSPFTREPLATQILIPNRSIKSAIDAWATRARAAKSHDQ